MHKTRLLVLIAMPFAAQGVLANTIVLKDRQDNICYNSASQNPGKVIGYGGINRNGGGFTMIISNPPSGAVTPATGDCDTIPKTPAGDLEFSGGNAVPNVVPVTHIKAGTNGDAECLDQGLNLSGVTGGASIGSGVGKRTINFSFNGADGCHHPNYSVPTYQAPFERTVSISTGSGPSQKTPYSGTYYIFNPDVVDPINNVPEPGSLLLMLAGASGLGALALARRRSGKRSK